MGCSVRLKLLLVKRVIMARPVLVQHSIRFEPDQLRYCRENNLKISALVRGLVREYIFHEESTKQI